LSLSHLSPAITKPRSEGGQEQTGHEINNKSRSKGGQEPTGNAIHNKSRFKEEEEPTGYWCE
jgi:hypothetical protein